MKPTDNKNLIGDYTLTIEKTLYDERVHNFIRDEILQYKRRGFSISETAKIVSMPEKIVKLFIDEAEDAIKDQQNNRELRKQRALDFERRLKNERTI